MIAGFEIRGSGGQLWLQSDDLTTRIVGVYSLSGTSGTIFNSAFNPGNTTYQLFCSKYYDSATNSYDQIWDDASDVANWDDGIFQINIRVEISNGRVDWEMLADSGAWDGTLDPKGTVYLYLINYDG